MDLLEVGCKEFTHRKRKDVSCTYQSFWDFFNWLQLLLYCEITVYGLVGRRIIWTLDGVKCGIQTLRQFQGKVNPQQPRHLAAVLAAFTQFYVTGVQRVGEQHRQPFVLCRQTFPFYCYLLNVLSQDQLQICCS